MMHDFDPEPPAIVLEAESLKDIAKKIGHLAREGLERFRDCGIELLKAKERCGHGEFADWIKKHVSFSYRTARRFMAIAQNASKMANLANLEEAFVEPQSEEPHNVTTNTKLLCRPCRTGGAKPGCKECYSLNHPPNNQGDAYEGKPPEVDDHGRKHKKKSKPKPAPREDVKDMTGAVVPENCRDIFADTTLADIVEEMEQVESAFQAETLVKRVGGLTKHYGFIVFDKFTEHAYQGLHEIQVAIENARAGIPYAVCPECGGQEKDSQCPACLGYRYVPEHRWKAAKNA